MRIVKKTNEKQSVDSVFISKHCVQVTVVPDVASKFLESIPLRRFGSPDEVAACAAFLVSDDASYITGETLVIAGGTHARL